MQLIKKIRDALRRWLLTPDEQTGVSPNRLTLHDGTTVIPTGYAGLCLVVEDRTDDADTAGGRRLITPSMAVDPAQFWDVWHSVSGETLTLPDGTPFQPGKNS